MTQPSIFARLLRAIVFGCLVSLASPALADDFTWTGAIDNNWSNAGNWVDGGPGAQVYPGELGADQDKAIFAIAATPTLDVAPNRIDLDIQENLTVTVAASVGTTVPVRNLVVTAGTDGTAVLNGTASVTASAAASSIDVTENALTINTLDVSTAGVTVTVTGTSQLTLSALTLDSTSDVVTTATAVDVGTFTVEAGAGTATVTGAGGFSPTGGPTWTFNANATLSQVTHDANDTLTLATGANTVTFTSLSLDEDATLATGAGNALVIGAGGIDITNGAAPADITGTAGLTIGATATIGTAGFEVAISSLAITGTPTVTLAGADVTISAITVPDGATVDVTSTAATLTAITLAEGGTIDSNTTFVDTTGLTVTAGTGNATISGTNGLRPTATMAIDTTNGDLLVSNLELTQGPLTVNMTGANTQTYTLVDWDDCTVAVDGPTVAVNGLQAGINDADGGVTALTLTSGQITIENGGTVTVNGTTNATGTLDVNGGTLIITDDVDVEVGASIHISAGTNHSITGTLNHNGSNTLSTFLTLAATFTDELDVDGNLDFGDTNGEDARFIHAGGTLRLGGNWLTGDDDVYTASGTATVVLDGAGQTLDLDNSTAADSDFVNLTVEGTGTKTVSNYDPGGDFTVSGTLTINAATFDLDAGDVVDVTAGAVTINNGTLDLGGRSLDVNGLLTIGDGADGPSDADLVGTGAVNVFGGITMDTTDGDYEATGLLTFDGTGDWDGDGDTFPCAVDIDGASITVTLTGDVTVSGLLDILPGETLELGGQTLTANGDLDVQGDLFTTTNGAVLNAAGVVEIFANGEISMGGGSGATTGTGRFNMTNGNNNFVSDSGGQLTLGVGTGGVAMTFAGGTGDFKIDNTNSTLVLGTGNIEYAGDLLNYRGDAASARFTSGGGAFVFTGTSPTAIDSHVDGGQTNDFLPVVVDMVDSTDVVSPSGSRGTEFQSLVIANGVYDVGTDNQLVVTGLLTLGDTVAGNGTLTGSDTVNVGGGLLANTDGVYSGTGTLTFEGSGDWTDNNTNTFPNTVINGTGTILVDLQSTISTGTFTVSGTDDTVRLNGQTLNTGNLDVTGNIFNLTDAGAAGGSSVLAVDGTVDINNTGEISLGGASGATASTGQMTVTANNNVTVATGGTFTSSAGQGGAAVVIADGTGNLNFNDATLTHGTGQIQHGGDTLQWNDNVTVTGTGTIVLNRAGNITIDSGATLTESIGNVEIAIGANTATVANGTDPTFGDLTLTSGTLNLTDFETMACASFNATGGTLNTGQNGGATPNGLDAVIDCAGDFTIGAAATLVQGVSTDGGAIEEIEVGGNLALLGTITSDANTVFALDGGGSVTLSVGASAVGEIRLRNGTDVQLTSSVGATGEDLQVDDAGSVLDLNGNTMSVDELVQTAAGGFTVTDTTGGGVLTLTATQNEILNPLTLSGGTIDVDGAYDAASVGALSQNEASGNASAFVFAGAVNLTGGDFDATAGTVQFDGGAQAVTLDGSETFFNLQTTGTSGQVVTVTTGGNGLDVNGSLTLNGQDLTVSGGGLVEIEAAITLTDGDLDIGTGQLSAGGDVSISGGDTLSLGSGGTNVVAGDTTGAGTLDTGGNDLTTRGSLTTNGFVSAGTTDLIFNGSDDPQTFTLPGNTTVGTLTVDHSVGGGAPTDRITIGGTGTLTTGAVNVTQGVLDMEVSSIFDGGGGVGLTVEANGAFLSDSTDNLTHDFQGTTDSIVINSGSFTVTDPTDNANPTTVSIEGGTNVDLNGTASFTLAGTATANLDFLRATTAGNFNFDTTGSTATLNFTNVDVVEADGAGNVPYVLASPSTTTSTDANWIVGVVWDGAVAGDGVWGNAINWVGGVAPTAGETAVLAGASNGANDPTSGNLTVAGFVMLSAYTDTATIGAGNTLTVTGDVALDGTNGGTLSINATGTLATTGDMTLTDNGSGPITTGGVVRFNATGTQVLTTSSNNTSIAGTLEVGDADSDTLLEFANGNLFTVGGLRVDDQGNAAGTASTLDLSDNDNVLNVDGDVVFENNAFLTNGNGDLRVAGNWTSGGNAPVGGTGTLRFDGAATQVYTAGGELHNAVEVDDGGTGTTLRLDSTLNTGTLLVSTGDTLNLNGNLAGTSGNVDVSTGGSLNTGTGELEVGGDLDVDGTLTSAAGGTVDVDGDIVAGSDGTLTMTTGTLEIAGAMNLTNLNFSSTGLVDFNGTGTEALTLNGGTETFTNVQLSGATQTIQPTGAFVVLGTLAVLNGSTLDMDTNDVTLDVTGTTTLGTAGTSGSLDLGDGVTTDLDGSLTIAVGGGTISQETGTLELAGGFDVQNGTFDPAGGTVTFDGTGTQTVIVGVNSEQWRTVNVSTTGGGIVEVQSSPAQTWATRTELNVTSGVLDLETSSDFQGARTDVSAGATLRNDDVVGLTHTFSGVSGGECLDLASGAPGATFSFTAATTTLIFDQGNTVDVNGDATTVFTFTSTGGTMRDENVGNLAQFTIDVDASVNFSVSGVTVQDSIAAGGAAPLSNSGGTLVNTTNWVVGVVWSGAVSGDWNNGGNWSGGLPGPGDTAVFNSSSNAALFQPTTNSGLGTINGLSIGGGYTQTAALAVNGLTITGDVAFDGTTNADFSFGGQTVTVGGDLSVTSTATGLFGDGTGTLVLNGATPTLAIGSGATTLDTTLQIGDGGATAVTPGATAIDVDGLTVSAGGGSLDLSASNPVLTVRGALTVSGTLTAGTSDVTVEGNLSVAGTLVENDGDTIVEGNVSVTGAWTNDVDGTLVFAAPSLALATQGAQFWTSSVSVGEVLIDNGDADANEGAEVTLSGNALADEVTISDNDELVIADTRTLTAGTFLTVGGGTSGTLTVQGSTNDALLTDAFTVSTGATYTESARDTLVSGTLIVAGTWSNNAGGSLRLDGANQDWTGTNLGEVLIEGAAGTVDLQADASVLTLDVGANKILDTGGNDLSIGNNTVASPFTIDAAGTYTANAVGSLTTIASTGGTIPTVDASYRDLTVSSTGTDTLEGDMTIPGTLTITGGTLATPDDAVQAADITGTGTLNASGGGGTSTITTTGDFEPAGYLPGTSLTFNGTGAWGRTGAAAATANYGAVIVQSGTVTVDTAELGTIQTTTLTVSGGTLAMGTTNFTPSSTVDLTTGSFTQAAGGTTTITQGQTFTTDGDTLGSLAISGAGTVTFTGDVTLAGTTAIAAGQTLEVDNTVTTFTATGLITIGGAGSKFDLNADAVLGGGVTVNANGLFEANEDAITIDFADNTTVILSVATATITLDPLAGQTTIRGNPGGLAANRWTMNVDVGTFNFSDLQVRDSNGDGPGALNITVGGLKTDLGNNVGWDGLNAVNAQWNGASDNDWDDTGNWVGGNLPVNGSVVEILATAPNAPQDRWSNLKALPGAINGGSINGLIIPDGWNFEVQVDGATMEVTGDVSVGDEATFTFNEVVTTTGNLVIDGGVDGRVDAQADLVVGGAISGSGTLDADDGVANVDVTAGTGISVTTYVKPTGTGTLTINGGTWQGASDFGVVILGGAVAAGSDLDADSLNLNDQVFTLGANTIVVDALTDEVATPAGTFNNANAAGVLNTTGGLNIGNYVTGGDLQFNGDGPWTIATTTDNFGDVVIQSGNITQGSAILATSIDVQGGGDLITGANALETTGAFTLTNGDLSATTNTVRIGGDYDSAGGAATFSATGVLLFNGGTHAADFTGTTDTLGILRLSGGATVNVVDASTFNVETVDLVAGTLDAGDATTINVDDDWLVAAGSVFAPATSTVDFTAGAAHLLTLTGTTPFYDVDFSGNTASTTTNMTVDHDLFVSGGTFSFNAQLDVTRNVTVSSGTLTALGTSPIFVGGDWDNAGTFNANNSVLTFDTTDTHLFTGGGSTYYDVTLSLASALGTVTLQDDVTVSNQVTLTQGVFDVDVRTLTLQTANADVNDPIVDTPNGDMAGNGAGEIFYDITAAGTVTVAAVSYNNLRLSHNNAGSQVFVSAGAFTVPGTMTLVNAGTGTSFRLAGDLTVGSLAGNGTVDMNATTARYVLELTDAGASVFPPGVVLANFRNAALESNSTVRFNNAGAVTVGNRIYPDVELNGNGSYTMTAGSVIEGNLELNGGSTFATPPDLEFGGAISYTSTFDGNNSNYTVGTLTVNVVDKPVDLDGNFGATRQINDLQLLAGRVEILREFTILEGVIGTAGAPGDDARLVHQTSNVTLTLGDATAVQQLQVFDEFFVADGNPDVTLTLASDGAGNYMEIMVSDANASLRLLGNQSGAGTTSNLLINSTLTTLTDPPNTPGASGEARISSLNATIPSNAITVNRVDVRDNDASGVFSGNRNADDFLGTFAGPGLEATNSSQLNAFTNGWTFSGGGSITAVLGEAVNNTAGKIDTIRIVFDQSENLDAATLGTVHDRFTLVLLDGSGAELESIVGTASSIEPNSRNLVLTFGDGIGKTDVENLEVRYTPPALSSEFLRNENSTPASFAFTVTADAAAVAGGDPELVDGASPVVVSSFFQDVDLNGGLDRAVFFLSESAAFTSGAGWCASGFQPATETAALPGQELTLVIAGETLAPITLNGNGNLFSGAAIAALIQSEVRAVMEAPPVGHNPLNRPAYKNFTCVYLESEERYVMTAGIPLQFTGGAYVRDYSSSTVSVSTGGANDASSGLKLDDGGGGGRVEGAGYGDGQPGVNVGTVNVTGVNFSNTILTLSLNAEPAFNVELAAAGLAALEDMALDVEEKIRGVSSPLEISDPTGAVQAALADANQEAYAGFVVVVDDVTVPGSTTLVFMGGGEGARSSVVVEGGTTFAAAAGMTDAAGTNTDVSGANNTEVSLEDLSIVAPNGENLLLGATSTSVTITGTTVVVDLANQAGSGQATPSYTWRDNNNGGFLSDASGLPNRAADFANVAASDGIVIIGDVDGDKQLDVDPGTGILVDATNSIPAFGTTGTSATFNWALQGTAPAGFVLNSNNTAVLNFDATTPGTYEFLLTVTVLDASGSPVVSPFTNEDGQIVATVNVEVLDVAPVADAGEDQFVLGATATLDGTGTFDPNGGAGTLTYQWTAVDADNNVVGAAAFTADTALNTDFTPSNVVGFGSGAYTVTLTATKTATGETHANSALIVINDPANLLPVAIAGSNFVGRTNTVISLNGSASADPEGSALTYDWQVLTSPVSITLGGAATVNPTFNPDLPGSYVFQLIVQDASGLSSPGDTVTVQVVDDLGTDTRRPPAAVGAVAALEQVVFLSATPGGSMINNPPFFVLAGGEERQATVVDIDSDPADDPDPGETNGMLTVQVVVAGTLFATVYSPLEEGDLALLRLRFADNSTATVYRFGRVGTPFVLDASQSLDDGAVDSFTWTQTDGPYKFDTQNGNLISVVPQAAATYEFELFVTDNISLTSLGQLVTVPVLPVLASPAGPPTADAVGGSGTILKSGVATASPNATITLDGSGSSSLSTGQFAFGTASDLTYSWKQLSGPTALFTGSTTGVTASATVSVAGPYSFQLTVTDGNNVSSKATVWISVDSPVADAPVAVLQSISDRLMPSTGSATITLNGTLSVGLTPLSYVWSQSAGPPYFVETSSGSGQGTVTIDQAATYTFALEVVGADGVFSPPAEVTFVIRPRDQDALASGGKKSGSDGCALGAHAGAAPGPGALLLLLLGLVGLGVRRRVGE